MTDLDLAVPQPAKQYLDLAHHVGPSPPERLVDRQHVTFRERQIRRKRLSQNVSVLNQRIEDRGDRFPRPDSTRRNRSIFPRLTRPIIQLQARKPETKAAMNSARQRSRREYRFRPERRNRLSAHRETPLPKSGSAPCSRRELGDILLRGRPAAARSLHRRARARQSRQYGGERLSDADHESVPERNIAPAPRPA